MTHHQPSSISPVSLYPIVRDLTEEEFGGRPATVWCCPPFVTDDESSSIPCGLRQWILFPTKEETAVSCTGSSQPTLPTAPAVSPPVSPPTYKPQRLRPSKNKRQRLCKNKLYSFDSTTSQSTTECEHRPTTVFDSNYVLTRQIFQCESSEVWECIHRKTGQRYCVKIMDPSKRPLRHKHAHEVDVLKNAILHEIEMLRTVQSHPSVVQLIEVLKEQQPSDNSSNNKDHRRRTYVVMEHLTGGNLLSHVVKEQGLPETVTKQFMRSVLEGIVNLQGQGICHNDLQASNILLDGDGTNNQHRAKIADFGRAAYITDSAPYISLPGLRRNISYSAPELLHGAIPDATTDMWSFGVLLYFCLFGRAPFSDDSGRPILDHIERANYTFPAVVNGKKEMDEISRAAKQLISGLLHTDPTVRFTAIEALQHPWFTAIAASDSIHSSRAPSFSHQTITTSARQKLGTLWSRLTCGRRGLDQPARKPYFGKTLKSATLTTEESSTSVTPLPSPAPSWDVAVHRPLTTSSSKCQTHDC